MSARDVELAASSAAPSPAPMWDRSVLLVRHAETAWTRAGRYQGRSDISLSISGVGEACAAAKRLAALPAAEILTSPLARAMETAEMIASVLKRPAARVEPQLIEIAYGEWEGLTQAQIGFRWPDQLRRWKTDPRGFRFPGGESLLDVQERVQGFFHAQAQRFDLDPRPVIAVTHQAVIRLALMAARGEPLDVYRHIKVPTTGMCRIEIGEGAPSAATPPVREVAW